MIVFLYETIYSTRLLLKEIIIGKYQMNGINIKGFIRNLNSIENIYYNRISIYNIIG